MMKRNSILLYFVISIYMFSCNGNNKSNTIIVQDLNSKLNNEFVQVIEDFIDSVETNWTLKPLLGIENFYYSVKFFEMQGSVFFTVRTSHVFPDYEYFNNTFYKNDTSWMYYFKIHNRNLIVIDYPKSKGHGIFEKNVESNYLAVEEMKENETLLKMKKDVVSPSNPDIFRQTFKVEKTNIGIELTKLDSVILVPPYTNESQDCIQIIEEDL